MFGKGCALGLLRGGMPDREHVEALVDGPDVNIVRLLILSVNVLHRESESLLPQPAHRPQPLILQ